MPSTKVIAVLLTAISLQSCARYARSYYEIALPVPLDDTVPLDSEAIRKGAVLVTSVVDLLLHSDGAVSNAKIRRSCGYPVLDSASIRAAERRTFSQVQGENGKLDGTWIERAFSYHVGLEFWDGAGMYFSSDLLRLRSSPRITRDVEAVYPYWAEMLGLHGAVGLSLWLRKDGAVSHGYLRKSSGRPSLDTLAIKAAIQCRFTPALDSAGRPINVWVEGTTVFGQPKGRSWK